MNRVRVTQEQYQGVQDLINKEGREREAILKDHFKALQTGNKKFWTVASLNDLSYEQMALLLYNLDYVDVEPSTEDKLRLLASLATNQNYYNGVVDTAELLGFPRSTFDSVQFDEDLPS